VQLASLNGYEALIGMTRWRSLNRLNSEVRGAALSQSVALTRIGHRRYTAATTRKA
jgi:hypothetical protein